MAIRVFIADDHMVVRDGLRLILEKQGDLEVIGEAGDGSTAAAALRELAPDVAVLDIRMPGLDGISLCRQLREAGLATRVVILSMYATHEHVHRAFEAGAMGYVLKESAAVEVVAAIRAAADGRSFVGSGIDGVSHETVQAGHARGPVESMSEREREVLLLVVQGLSSSAIGRRLNLSAKTVETYRTRFMRKLGLSGLPALVKFAVANGLVPPE